MAITYRLNKGSELTWQEMDDNLQQLYNLATQQGQNGLSAYELWLQEGNSGTINDFLNSIIGEDGDSAYEVAVNNGFEGTEQEWLDSLQAEYQGGTVDTDVIPKVININENELSNNYTEEEVLNWLNTNGISKNKKEFLIVKTTKDETSTPPPTEEQSINIIQPIEGEIFTEGDTITILTTTSANSGDFYSDVINEQINNSSDTTIDIGTEGQNETYILDKPIIVTEPGKTLNLHANLKMQNGYMGDVLEDAPIGSTVIKVANANHHFKIGQQVSVTDDNGQGQGHEQIRKFGNSGVVIDVDETSVTLSRPTLLDISVDANAKIGHYQSALIIMASDTTIEGIGDVEIDVNGENNYWETFYGLRERQGGVAEDTQYGCGITFDYNGVNNISINNITVRNAPLHNITLWNTTNYSLTNINLYNCHDKNILFYGTDEGYLDSIYIDGSLYEDGLGFYNSNTNITIGYAEVHNCPRQSVLINRNGNYYFTIDTLVIDGSKMKIGGAYITAQNITIDGTGFSTGSTGGLLEIECISPSITEDINIVNLNITNAIQGRAITTSGDCISNVVINDINIDNVKDAFGIGGGDVHVLGGIVQNVTNELFNIGTDAILEIDGVHFENYANEGESSEVIIKNSTGITNNS